MTHTYVIIDHGSQRFYTEGGWSTDYPDAHLYASLAKAMAGVQKAHKTVKGGSRLDIVKNYGLVDDK